MGNFPTHNRQWILLLQKSVSSKHLSAFIQTVRNKPLESNASSKQLKRLRKLWFLHSIWGEEAKLPHWEQPTFPYNPYSRGVTAAQLQLQTRQHCCRILLFLLTDQMVLIHRSQTQHFPSPCSQIPESHRSICNLQRNSFMLPSEGHSAGVSADAKTGCHLREISSRVSVSHQWAAAACASQAATFSLSFFF